MRNLLNKTWVKRVCDLCLALSAVMVAGEVSYMIFGEPDYPTED